MQRKFSKKILHKTLSVSLLAAVLSATLGIQTFIFHAPRVEAASVSWTGGMSGTWETAGNWSNNAVPTSSDDVTINRAGGAIVTASSGSNISFSTLTLGGNGDQNIFQLVSNITSGGSITIENGGSFIQKNWVAQTISGTLTINSGGQLQHEDNTTAESYKIDITAGTITINSGATINVNARGYQGDQAYQAGDDSHNGYGPGKGLNQRAFESGSGAGHAGIGGKNDDAIQENGGGTYGSSTDPATLGSGGGGSGNTPTVGKGGDGGGLVRLTSTGNITVAGSITANGGDGCEDGSNDCGGGSGGAIKLYGNTVNVSNATIRANGGASGTTDRSGGGGGGGYIRISYTSYTNTGATITVTGGAGFATNGTGADGSFTTEQRTPTLQFSSSSSSFAESSSCAITVTLSSATGSDVTANYSVAGTATSGTDYTALTGNLTITGGSTSTTINVTYIDDSVDEADETVILTLYNVSSNALIGSTTVHTCTIIDNDSGPTVQFTSTTSSDSEGNLKPLIGVSLSAVSAQNVTVDYAVSGASTATGGGTDYTLSNGTLTIEAGKTSKNIEITGVNDSLVESDETIVISLSNATNATVGANGTHTYTIKDNDGMPTVQFVLTNSEAAEGTTPNIAVQLSKAPANGQDVQVTYTITGTATNPTNYILASPGTITLTNTTPLNITPTLVTDADSINQTMLFTLSGPTNANLGANTTHLLTIKESSVSSSVPTNLTVNGSPTPATVATENPLFGWKFVPGVTSDSERAFQFLIATSEANLSGGTYVCDSGKVTNRYSAHTYSNICTGTLLAGTYYWKVRTYNSTDTASSYSSVQTLIISSVISPPTTCTQASTTATSFTLGWTDNASNETGFEIEQALATGFSQVNDGLWRRITTAPANAVSYDITGLTPNKIYYYRIRAVNNTGSSSYLTCSSSFSPLAQTPDAPSVTPLSTTSLRVIINPASNDTSVQYAINVNTTQYVQANGTLGASAAYQAIYGWSERGVTVTGLSPNTAYIVNVIARDRNNQATSASSSTTRYTLAEKMIVSTSSPAFSSFNFSIGTNGNPAGTLAAVTVFDGTSTRYAQTNGSLSNASVTQTPATWGSLQMTNLPTSTNFRLQAIAYNGDLIPTYSFPAAARTQASSPTSFRATALSDMQASLYVDSQSGYQYLFDNDAGGLQAQNTKNVSVSNNTSANHTIKLNNGSDTPTVTMAFCGGVLVPGTPSLDTTPLTDKQLRLAINASTNPTSTEYLIHEIVTNKYVTTLGTLVSPDAVNWSTIWTTKANFGGDTGVIITGLTAAEDYEFEIKARNCQNIESAYSTSRVASTNPAVPAVPTVSVTSDATGASAARIIINVSGFSTLTLSQVDFAIYDATTNQYVTNVSGATSGNGALGASESWAKYADWGGSNGYLITGLPPNVTHHFAIKAKKTTNGTPVETAFSQKTAAVLSANRPFITLESVTTSSVSLSVNPYSNSPLTEYIFELVPSSGSSTYLQSGGTNNTFTATPSWTTLINWFGYDGTADEVLTISGLSSNTAYTLRTQARNSNNTSGYSSPTVTIYTASATPTSVSATAASDTRINLSWGVASNPAGTEYLISESSTGKYVVTNALSTSSTWSTFDNLTPTNSTYVSGLSASTQYCFTIKGRNGHSAEGTAAAAVCTSTAAGAGGGTTASSGGSSSSSTPTTSTPSSPTPAPTPTVTPAEESVKTPKPTPTPAPAPSAEPSTPTPTVTPAPTPAPAPSAEPSTPTPTVTPTPTPAPAPSAVDNSSTAGGTSSSGGSGGSSYVNPEEFKKQIEELKKQKEEGLITFQIGGLKKEVRTKAETGITRETFVAALISDLDLKKVYSKAIDKKEESPEKIAEKLNIISVFTDAGGTYDKTKFLTNREAFAAMLIAINITEAQACKEKIFDFCAPPNPNEKLTKEISDSLFRSSKNYLAAQNQARSRKLDTDHDKLPDWDEINIYGTDPTKSDSDGDGLSDHEEVSASRPDPLNPKDKSLNYKTDPLSADSDGDGLSDYEEIKIYKTNAKKIDTDGDGFSDKTEIEKKTDPLDPLDFPRDIEIGQGTKDSDSDGLCDRCETAIGTDPNNPDTDGDGIIDSLDAEPLKFNAKSEPVKLKITNIQSGMKIAASPLVQGTAQANSEISIIAKNEFGLKREIGRTQASENNIFAADLNPLPNGAYFLEAQNEKGETSPQVAITIDSNLNVDPPKLETIDDKPLKENYQPEVSSSPLIKARLLSGKAIITFRSAIGTATLISDTPTGLLEIRPPENLTLGEHEVIAYAIREDDNAISPVVKYRFRVTQASEYNANDFFIKNASGGKASLLREKTVWPIFKKIFTGVGILLILWFIISLVQFSRRQKK